MDCGSGTDDDGNGNDDDDDKARDDAGMAVVVMLERGATDIDLANRIDSAFSMRSTAKGASTLTSCGSETNDDADDDGNDDDDDDDDDDVRGEAGVVTVEVAGTGTTGTDAAIRNGTVLRAVNELARSGRTTAIGDGEAETEAEAESTRKRIPKAISNECADECRNMLMRCALEVAARVTVSIPARSSFARWPCSPTI